MDMTEAEQAEYSRAVNFAAMAMIAGALQARRQIHRAVELRATSPKLPDLLRRSHSA